MYTFEYGLTLNKATKKISNIEKKIKLEGTEPSPESEEPETSQEIPESERYADVN